MRADAILPAIRRRLEQALAFDAAGLVPLWADDAAVGMLDRGRAQQLARYSDVLIVRHDGVHFALQRPGAGMRSAAMAAVATDLAARGLLSAWRDERYAVTAPGGTVPLFLLERAAARFFGIHTHAVHANGVATVANGTPRLWIARRSRTKAIDPGMLDNLVGGGVAAGLSHAATLVKESWEEAGIAAALAERGRAAGTLHTLRRAADGVQRESLHVYDLALPPGFVPANQDGEASGHRLVDTAEAVRLLAHDTGDDAMTVDATLVTFDWLLRSGAVPAGDGDARAIAALAQVPVADPGEILRPPGRAA